jgi:hypothetical protein
MGYRRGYCRVRRRRSWLPLMAGSKGADSGALWRDPAVRLSKGGKQFVTALVKAASRYFLNIVRCILRYE